MRGPALVLVTLLGIVAFSGCFGNPKESSPLEPDAPLLDTPHGVYVSTGSGTKLGVDALGDLKKLLGTLHGVGERGPEPSLGVTSKGTIFFQALEKTMRSTDGGKTFTRSEGPLTALDTGDPYLWVDPVTDRVFQINMGAPFGGGLLGPEALLCSHIAWSDDEGATWLANPADCGPVPVNDHIKLATGPWTGALQPASANPAYPNAVYYAYNKLVGGFMAVSLDGGATFPILSKMFDGGCSGALHGAITTSPDGTIYVPARYCPAPLVATSRDNGVTWTQKVVGQEVGVPEQQKNPEIAVDAKNNAYMAWVGKDNQLHMTYSKDHAATWSKPVLVSAPDVLSTIWPAAVAGDEGRVGFAYIGTQDSSKGAWAVPEETRWHLYYTYTLNALAEDPTFVTIQLTDNADPIQVGTICVRSSSCSNGNRNLLDFIDMVIDKDGRPYIAYADGCTSPECLSASAKPSDSRDRAGMVAILQEGPSLYEKAGILKPLGTSST